MSIRIGTSGWSYDHWTDVLYPPGLPAARRLERYVAELDTVELNASFYRWPRDAAFASWRARLPPGFIMTVKAPRGLTHARRLLEPETWTERVTRGLHELGDRRGPLLVQLRPDHERDDARLDWFLAGMPAWVQVAVELRHPSWQTDEVFDLLARHGAAYVVVSGAGIPCVLRATARLVYVRLHGPDHHHLYAGSYSDDDLRWWADRIREWDEGGHDVVAYFNNDGEGHAVRNARTLRALLG
ncbi:DUF72 domain-containing protein [Cellulomonas gilvus]|uniref:Sensor histidine kinase n=1 Tax=Cellulomonas gilvus (strain ATCC 13127 / NRRL B-14078) TaxID=593907 RepID=F8A4W9_CELGA|nr:DUF72 domain-containing protein [Cellulomonas gilvus]AEI12072.1 protein of unknown function DUF72 [Cellulomonas gilvus ATCC 13127]